MYREELVPLFSGITLLTTFIFKVLWTFDIMGVLKRQPF